MKTRKMYDIRPNITETYRESMPIQKPSNPSLFTNVKANIKKYQWSIKVVSFAIIFTIAITYLSISGLLPFIIVAFVFAFCIYFAYSAVVEICIAFSANPENSENILETRRDRLREKYKSLWHYVSLLLLY